MTAPEPQTWAWGDPEPEPTPGWEFETQWEFGGGQYTRVYTRPALRRTDLYGVSCADSEHEITEMCWRCGREAHEIYGEESK